MTRSRVLLAVLLPGLAAADSMPLRQGWMIRSSAGMTESGAVLSTTSYKADGWHNATLPSTVLSALVRDKVYPDPYVGMNLRQIPGTTYGIGLNFSNLGLPEDSPFAKSWWYRTEFRIPAEHKGKTIWLGFDGINFRANVWLNGKQIASADKMAGAWRLFEFDVTPETNTTGANALAIEVFAPTPHDLGITFVDWNPLPPDKDMGLWRDVHIRATGPVEIRFPSVATHLNSPANDLALLSVRAELTSAASHPVEGDLKGTIGKLAFSQHLRLGAHETRVVHAALKVENPELWWPAQVGPQTLQSLDLRFEVSGKLSDSSSTRFGIREVTSEIDGKGHRLFHVNGRNILIRGAGYTFDMLLNGTPERQEAELQYVRDMNLNAVRFEGKLEDDHFLDLADQYGILILAGWCCCDHWEKWPQWDAQDEAIAAASLRDQLRRLARHPSVFDWLYGSDNPPPPKIEQLYLDIIKEVEWPNPYQSSATAKKTPAGETGVKMTGPYEYVAPSYWTLDTTRGGAHGFNTETSPGPAPPPIETLRAMLPAEHLWPIDAWWNYHAGGGQFKDIHVFTEALNARYGAAASAEEYARKAQMMSYEGERAMFEAFGRNKYTSTGVIQWMLNNAWPGLIWHLYDWYLRPGGSYFGAKKACEPLHVQYSYDDRGVVVVNSYYQPFANMTVVARVLNLDMTEKFIRDVKVDLEEDSSTRAMTLPEIEGLSSTYFVSLELQDRSDHPVSRNLYWLSTKAETLDWEKSTWYVTPTKTFADYTALNSLPPAELQVTAHSKPGETTVSLINAGKAIAFGVHVKVKKGTDGDEILPVLWEDNYFSLLPGETREVTASYNPRALGQSKPVVEAEAWNRKSAVVK
ncbi:MAG: sugar-binding domain-containing protein [Bryobacteraceae bacterium]